jgi:CRP-like cAMP-binding protein
VDGLGLAWRWQHREPMVAHIASPMTAGCPCTHSPDVGVRGRCPLTDVQHRRGDRLFSENDPATTVWFIKRGCVLLSRTSAAGVETPHAIRRAGSFVGMETLVRDRYLMTARVTSAAILGRGSREVVDAWLAHGPSARMVLEEVLRTECGDAPRGAASEGSAVERVAHWIVAESARGAISQVPRGFAAGLLGMTPETFSRALGQLAGSGAIEVTRRTLLVHDPERLLAAARAAG